MNKFSLEHEGYNKEEVNQFINDVIRQTEEILNKYKLQSSEITKLKLENEHYHRIENSLNAALESIKSTKKDALENATKEAKVITMEAKNNASVIVNEALLRADKLSIDCQRMENNIKILKRRLKLILEQQQEIIDEIEVLELDNNN